MKYGIREVCDLVFKAKTQMKIGSKNFAAGQPVLVIDSAKTSTLEGQGTTVYAQGGAGNTRLVAWSGEKTLTFTVEDALISPVGLAILAGAGLIDSVKAGSDGTTNIRFHKTAVVNCDTEKTLTVPGYMYTGNGIFIFEYDNGEIGSLIEDSASSSATYDETSKTSKLELTGLTKGKTYFVDYYVNANANKYKEIQIDANEFRGNFYVEANSLMRDKNGNDCPIVITLPNVKIQSNFSIAFAATGDPSTFTFTMDALPGYTWFDQTKEVLCAIQVVEESVTADSTFDSIFDSTEANFGESTTTMVVASTTTTNASI